MSTSSSSSSTSSSTAPLSTPEQKRMQADRQLEASREILSRRMLRPLTSVTQSHTLTLPQFEEIARSILETLMRAEHILEYSRFTYLMKGHRFAICYLFSNTAELLSVPRLQAMVRGDHYKCIDKSVLDTDPGNAATSKLLEQYDPLYEAVLMCCLEGRPMLVCSGIMKSTGLPPNDPARDSVTREYILKNRFIVCCRLCWRHDVPFTFCDQCQLWMVCQDRAECYRAQEENLAAGDEADEDGETGEDAEDVARRVTREMKKKGKSLAEAKAGKPIRGRNARAVIQERHPCKGGAIERAAQLISYNMMKEQVPDEWRKRVQAPSTVTPMGEEALVRAIKRLNMENRQTDIFELGQYPELRDDELKRLEEANADVSRRGARGRKKKVKAAAKPRASKSSGSGDGSSGGGGESGEKKKTSKPAAGKRGDKSKSKAPKAKAPVEITAASTRPERSRVSRRPMMEGEDEEYTE